MQYSAAEQQSARADDHRVLALAPRWNRLASSTSCFGSSACLRSLSSVLCRIPFYVQLFAFHFCPSFSGKLRCGFVRCRSNLEFELDQRGGSPCLSLPASIQHKKKCTCKFPLLHCLIHCASKTPPVTLSNNSYKSYPVSIIFDIKKSNLIFTELC